jgi:hypothetical protein
MASGCAASSFGLDQGRYPCAMAYGPRAGAADGGEIIEDVVAGDHLDGVSEALRSVWPR